MRIHRKLIRRIGFARPLQLLAAAAAVVALLLCAASAHAALEQAIPHHPTPTSDLLQSIHPFAHAPLASPLPASPSFTFDTVAHQFLVGFHRYAPASEHERTLRALWREVGLVALVGQQHSRLHPFIFADCRAHVNASTQCPLEPLAPALDWRVLLRDNPGAALPTDFLLVHFDAASSAVEPSQWNAQILAAWQQLHRAHPTILKFVVQEKRVTRSLLSVAQEEEAAAYGGATGAEEEVDCECADQKELDHIDDAIHLHAPRVRTTADLSSRSAEATMALEDEFAPTSPTPGGVGDFPPPQRFDLGRHGSVIAAASEDGDAAPSSRPPSPLRRKLCQWGSGGGNSPTELLKASKLWEKGFQGADIRIAIFDTGLSATHPHFAHVDERTNWTDEPTLEDGLGHGTFVAGVIAAGRDCLGFAPEARLHIFRVFNQRQLSFTSWFLDAFNYAIHSRVHVLNLSIGGPDFLDRPFVEKVNEMSANGITVVSAIGNDGPLWGTLNNPADQMDVIGVGGHNEDGQISAFSSRGMTTAELPSGYGRLKPDLVALARNIRGSNQGAGCKTMSGTSVASPVVAGCVTLLASVVPPEERALKLNPAFLKQLLLESAVRLATTPPAAGGAAGSREGGPGIFEQGEGSISLEGAFALLQGQAADGSTSPAGGGMERHASIIPSTLDLTDCPYMWPYCTQPLYHTSQPIVLNLTVLNSLGVASYVPIDQPPVFHPADEAASALRLRFTHAESFWPWSGWFGVHIHLAAPAARDQVLSGWIEITLVTDDEHAHVSTVKLPLHVRVVPTPARSQRVLFDLFHNLRYPSGYFPRDNLEVRMDTLDWNGDHMHTNYRELYTALREAGYYVELLGRDYTCFDASLYGTLLVIDPEEEYFVEEVAKLQDDLYLEGLHLLVLAEWYNTRVMREIKFYDENTAEWWTPETGGANIPALNALLAGFGVQLTDHVVKGDVTIGGETFYYASGTTISRWPTGGFLQAHHLVDAGSGAKAAEWNVLGIYEPASPRASPTLAAAYPKAGRLFVYGDSNCVDMNHRRGNLCASLVINALKYLNTGDKSALFQGAFANVAPLSSPYVHDPLYKKPRRAIGNNLIKYSKVTSPGSAPQCPVMSVETEGEAVATATTALTKDKPLVVEKLTAISVYEQAHTALIQASAPAAATAAPSADEAKASTRFGAMEKLQQKKRPKKRRKIDDGPPASASSLLVPSGTTDRPLPGSPPNHQPTGSASNEPNKPSLVLAKQARLDQALGESDPQQQQHPFYSASSPSLESAASRLAAASRQEARVMWMRIGLLVILLCLVLVAYLYRKQLHLQSLAGKQSPAQTPAATATRLVQQPRAMVL